MEFKPENVYYALNADESLIGAKGYFAQSIDDLRYFVVENCGKINEVISLDNDFMVQAYDNYNFFYLVEPAPTKPKYRPFKDCDELISYFCRKYSILKTDWGMPVIWVKNKNHSEKYLIIAVTENCVVLYVNGQVFDMQKLFDSYTFLDGSVCGVEE